MAEAGWYPDPYDGKYVQYFDGQQWTGERYLADEANAEAQTNTGSESTSEHTPAAQAALTDQHTAQHGPVQPATSQPPAGPGGTDESPAAQTSETPLPGYGAPVQQSTEGTNEHPTAEPSEPEEPPTQLFSSTPPYAGQGYAGQGYAPAPGQGSQSSQEHQSGPVPPASDLTIPRTQLPESAQGYSAASYQQTQQSYQQTQQQAPQQQAAPQIPPAAQIQQDLPIQQPTQQGQGQPTQGGYGSYGGYAPAQYGTPGQGYPPAGGNYGQPPKKRRGGLIAAAVVVVLVVAGGLVFFLTRSSTDKPTLTYQGKKIANASDVLKSAEASVSTLVTTNHGKRASDTRCYFAVPTDPPSGAKDTDVDNSLRCGPVLFLEGNVAKQYLSYSLSSTGTSGGKATLSASPNPTSDDPDAVPSSVKLQRPDGKKPPSGNGGLTVPLPPPAAADTMVAVSSSDVSAPAAPDAAVMNSLNTGVRLENVGVVSSYGHGNAARSAPAGDDLIAFRYIDEPGESSPVPSTSKLTLSTGTGAARPLPAGAASGSYIVFAAPKNAQSSLTLSDAGYKQTLSLPKGQPGSNNIAVLARQHRAHGQAVHSTATATLQFVGQKGVTLHLPVHLRKIKLDFWAQGVASQHPTSPTKAYLEVSVAYSDPRPQYRGSGYGFPAGVVKLKLPDGSIASAKNVATDGRVLLAFEVPASFTKGTVLITGKGVQQGARPQDTLTFTVSKAATMPVDIQAG